LAFDPFPLITQLLFDILTKLSLSDPALKPSPRTILGHASLLDAGSSRGVVQVLGYVLLRVLLLASVAPSLPVRPLVPDATESHKLNISWEPQQNFRTQSVCVWTCQHL